MGGTKDLHAGQFVDRLGVAMGLPFPCGKRLEELAQRAGETNIKLPASVNGLHCSFSGVETAARSLIGRVQESELALAAYESMAHTFAKMILRAATETGHSRVLLAGGVASSALLRHMLLERLADKNIQLFFGLPELSSDNAVGAALLAMDKGGKELN